jgi:adenylate kinase family enzyme
MIRCILFGNMCSGKTSVGRFLAAARGHAVVSAKDAVAKNLATATDEVRALRAKGYLLPDPVITDWVLGAVASEVGSGRQVIVDGFPRTEAQARELVHRHGNASCVVFCDFPTAVLERRFLSRLLCADCDLPSNKAFLDFDGRCLLCGGTSFAPRPTDRPDYMEVKTRQFESESMKVLPVLRAAGMTFLSVRDQTRQRDLQREVTALDEQIEGALGH